MRENNLPGQPVITYPEEYNPKLLRPISRKLGRQGLSLQPFKGYDLWRCYEFTCLNHQGMPQSRLLTIKVPCNSPCLIESKSLKLYLFSFSATKFTALDDARAIIAYDLSRRLESEVEVKLYPVDSQAFAPDPAAGYSLLEQELPGLNIREYEPNPALLSQEGGSVVKEKLKTNLLRSLCPLTAQPDYAAVYITYEGLRISHESLLRYLISLRRHQGFHEQCCEMIYCDLKSRLKLRHLSVACAFTRRGGIDITPVRFDAFDPGTPRSLRQ